MGSAQLQGGVLTTATAVVLAIPGAILAGFSLYLVALAAASLLPRVPRQLDTISSAAPHLVVVVPAHNEEQLVERCVTTVLRQTYPRALYRVVVVADNCTDATASTAVASGAEVMIRDEPASRGKGRALRWAVDRLFAEPDVIDGIVVVDADSIADENLLAALAAEMRAGAAVVQADYELMDDDEGRRSGMARAGFLLFHRVRFTGRQRLGLPANVVGNGMLFTRRVLEMHLWDAFTGAEDLEYSMRLRLDGVRPRFAPEARIFGPGAASRTSAVRQRLRWEGGRFHVVRTMLPQLAAAAWRRRDVSDLDAIVDLATPPLGLLTLALAGGTALVAVATVLGVAAGWSLIPWMVGLAATPAFVVIGLASAGESGLIRSVLLGAPRFIAWKAFAYVRLVGGFDVYRWDRTERVGEARRVDIAGVPVDAVNMSNALASIREAIDGPRMFQVSTINLDFMVRAQSDPAVRKIFQRSDLNIPDGAPVVWLGRLLGAPIGERVAGADLVPALLAEAAKEGTRVFLLGGEGGVADIAAKRLEERFAGLQVVGTYEPPRAAVELMNNDDILERIAASRAQVLLVAFGHPKQEFWIDMHRDRLPVSVAIGVGCVFDILAGRSRRAPRWMQVAGLEWAYRLAREPRRLVWRYATDAAWLLPIAARAVGARFAGAARTAEPA